MAEYKFKRDVPPSVQKILYWKQKDCGFPDCKNPLAGKETINDKEYVASEICHIYSVTSNGPRPYPGLPSKDFINSEENLILLCGYHHNMIDRQENTYTANDIQNWKRNLDQPDHQTLEEHETHNNYITAIDCILYKVDQPIIYTVTEATSDGKKVLVNRQDQCYWLIAPNNIHDKIVLRDIFPPIGKDGDKLTLLIYSKNDINALGHSFNHSEMRWTDISDYRAIKKVSLTPIENFISFFSFLLISILTLIVVGSTATEKNFILFMIPASILASCPLLYRLRKFQRVKSDLKSVKETVNQKFMR